MIQELAGKTIVITGASRGLGAGLAQEFAARGANLGLCARNMIHESAHVAAPIVSVNLDVSSRQSMLEFGQTVEAEFGRIDAWINNAGVLAPIASLRDVTESEVVAHLHTNVLGVMWGSQAYIHHVRRKAYAGVLINISSGAARNAYAGWSSYCASKAAVDRLTECIALEEKDTGLRCYAVAPGVIDTDMQTQIRAASPNDFPSVGKFVELKAQNKLSSIGFVAKKFVRLILGQDLPETVSVGFPLEHD